MTLETGDLHSKTIPIISLTDSNDNSRQHSPSSWCIQISYAQLVKRVVCQICRETGHIVADCYHRFNLKYQQPVDQPESSSTKAFIVSNNDLPDPSCYLDTEASNHVAPDLSALSLHTPYRGSSKIAVGNGQNMSIANTGSGILRTPFQIFKLHTMFHVPKLSTNLVLVQKFVVDNNCSLTFDENKFVIQDKSTNKVIYQGYSRNGLYPTQASSPFSHSFDFVAFSATNTTAPLWHN